MPAETNDNRRTSIDLTQVTESTRRALYDAVVAVHFSPTSEEVRRAVADPENFWAPDYGPDKAGLTIYYAFGRWFTVWRTLEEPEDAPEELRWTVLRIGSDPESGAGGLTFSEV